MFSSRFMMRWWKRWTGISNHVQQCAQYTYSLNSLNSKMSSVNLTYFKNDSVYRIHTGISQHWKFYCDRDTDRHMHTYTYLFNNWWLQNGHLITQSYHTYCKLFMCVILWGMKTLLRQLNEQCTLCAAVIIPVVKVI